MRTTALIDADSPVYATCSYHEKQAAGEIDDKLMRVSIKAAIDVIQEIIKDTGCDDAVLCLSDGSFRHMIYPGYKANRHYYERPTFLEEVRSAVALAFPTCKIAGWEADDLLSVASAAPGVLLVSIDKDLKQIPGEHYNPNTKARVTVTPEEARRFLFTQWLVGDNTDNLKGAIKIGPKKAAPLVDEWLAAFGKDDNAVWTAALAVFEKTGVPVHRAIAEWNCIRLLPPDPSYRFDFGPLEPFVRTHAQEHTAAEPAPGTGVVALFD